MHAGRFARLDFYFDRARLTRREGFRGSHCGAPSARRYRFDFQLGVARISNLKASHDSCILRLLAELYGLRRRDQFGRFPRGFLSRRFSAGLIGRLFIVRLNLRLRLRGGRLSSRSVSVAGYRRRSVLSDCGLRPLIAVRRLRGLVARRSRLFRRRRAGRHQYHHQNGYDAELSETVMHSGII